MDIRDRIKTFEDAQHLLYECRNDGDCFFCKDA